MNRRCELTESQWAVLGPIVPGKAGDPGRSGADNRTFINCVLRVLWSGARWAVKGVWEQVFASLVKYKHNKNSVIGSSIVLAHQQAITGKGGTRLRPRGDPEVG